MIQHPNISAVEKAKPHFAVPIGSASRPAPRQVPITIKIPPTIFRKLLEFIDVKRDCFYHLKNIAYIIAVNPDDIICTNYKKPRAMNVKRLEADIDRIEARDGNSSYD